MRKKTEQQKDIEFNLKPITTIPEQMKVKKVYGENRYLTDGEYWDILHNMMRRGQIIRYRISGVCDIEAPKREIKRKTSFSSYKIHLVRC